MAGIDGLVTGTDACAWLLLGWQEKVDGHQKEKWKKESFVMVVVAE